MLFVDLFSENLESLAMLLIEEVLLYDDVPILLMNPNPNRRSFNPFTNICADKHDHF